MINQTAQRGGARLGDSRDALASAKSRLAPRTYLTLAWATRPCRRLPPCAIPLSALWLATNETASTFTACPGLPATRAAVAASLNRRFGTTYAAKDVFMTVGAAASVSCSLHALVNPGEEVIVIAPFFPEYRVWIENAGAVCRRVLASRGPSD